MKNRIAPEELLLDYAAGTLSEALALVVETHVALAPEAMRIVSHFTSMGVALFEDGNNLPSVGAALDQALAKLDFVAVETTFPAYVPPTGFEWAPPRLGHQLAKNTRWLRTLGSFEHIPIRLANEPCRVELLKLLPGRGLPQHHHAGNEYTVILQGGYTDCTGHYVVGDFAVGPGQFNHKPIADAGDPCIALTVLEKPVVLSGSLGRLLNPLVQRGWL
jgi:putative transcriptional regulator